MLLATSKTFTSPDFPLSTGGHLAELTVAYETWGTLDADAGNAILLCHGYTSHAHAGGDDGWLAGMLGPGKALDTDRYFVVCSNMLGSAHGTSGPPTPDPATGKSYGPAFPAYGTADMVAAQHRLLDHLGIGRLKAVVGFSYGGHLTFLWGATHPERMRALVPIAGPIKRDTTAEEVATLRACFEACPGWNGGDYYGRERESGVYDKLVELRLETMRRYGIGRYLEDTVADPDARERALQQRAETWAAGFDANSLIALRAAGIGSAADPAAISAPLLYVLGGTDVVAPPSLGPATVEALRRHGIDASYLEVDSPYGHMGPTFDAALWADDLRAFLDRTP